MRSKIAKAVKMHLEEVRRSRPALYSLGALVLIALAFGVLWLYNDSWVIQHKPAPRASEHTPVVHQAPVPNNIDQVRNWFGPWHLVDPESSGSAALVLIRGDGGMESSSWTAKVDQNWKTTDAPQIDQITYAANVEFTLGGLATYKVSYQQPFVLEQVPNRVYAFVRVRGIGKIVSTTPQVVKQFGHKI